jgi:voltage-gated sodium channel
MSMRLEDTVGAGTPEREEGDQAPGTSGGARLMARLRDFVEGKRFQTFITVAILINAVTLGLETSETVMAQAGDTLRIFDRVILAIFVFEIGVKLIVHRLAFFRNGWNVFDFVIVGISVMPATGNFSILRALRILRVLRLLSVVPTLRRVVEALLKAIPGMGAIGGVLVLVFYVGAVMATKLFGDTFPEWFGTIGGSMYSLFQIMTLESWSMGIVRPVMEVYPYAWAFFVPFIFLTSFMVLNLFIAIIVNSMQTLHDQEMKEIMEEERKEAETAHGERDVLLAEIRALREDVKALKTERGAAE